MKINRIAAVVAAATIAPSLFLAAPALAADTLANNTPRTGASAPAAVTEEMPVVMRFHDMPSTFTAGGDWSQFSLSMENGNDYPISDFWAYLVFRTSHSTQEQLKPGDAELEYFAGGEWHPVVLQFDDHRFSAHVCPQANPIPSDDPNYPEFRNCPARIDTVKPGENHTLKLRMRFAASAPATRGMVMANDYVSHPNSDLPTVSTPNKHRFTILPAEKAVQP
ncbi:hypothetical protein [Streptomyces halobius]|uniref:Uncharacterized protein n=1 Tax=Streptomyces halobius TaxID=2879846 RepID=A0ABY4MH29_9ACTN|nr:hypothetical protein [Streptomyces halobius]UQA96667.1 hypothetical protein K9S39_36625 [Streptomyces halobius]